MVRLAQVARRHRRLHAHAALIFANTNREGSRGDGQLGFGRACRWWPGLAGSNRPQGLDVRGGTRQRLVGVIWVARGELDPFSVVNTNPYGPHVVGALVDVCAQRTPSMRVRLRPLSIYI